MTSPSGSPLAIRTTALRSNVPRFWCFLKMSFAGPISTQSRWDEPAINPSPLTYHKILVGDFRFLKVPALR